MNDEILEHTHFEELCALASVGDISPPEYQELSDHLRNCAACRESYTGCVDLIHTYLPQVAADELREPRTAGFLETIKSRDYKARFVAHAREHGIEISGGNGAPWAFWRKFPALSFPRLSYQYASVAVIVGLLAVAGVLSHRWKDAEARNAAASAEVSKLAEKNVSLQQQLSELSRGKQGVETDLLETRHDSTGLAAQLRDLEEQVNKDDLALRSLRAELEASNHHEMQTEQKLLETQQTLVSVDQEAARLRATRTENDVATIAQQLEMADLTRRVKEQAEVIDKQQKLLGVDEDVRNLMAARNLHITDVFDVDGKGKRKAAFGRVFYTEGKSLIFYAFDLDGPKVTNTKHSFQAWGQRADSSTSAVNLGIFYVDDASQERWMLKFDNPEVLRQISAVFVTAEPHGGTQRPTGQKLMYAYLGHEPNHP